MDARYVDSQPYLIVFRLSVLSALLTIRYFYVGRNFFVRLCFASRINRSFVCCFIFFGGTGINKIVLLQSWITRREWKCQLTADCTQFCCNSKSHRFACPFMQWEWGSVCFFSLMQNTNRKLFIYSHRTVCRAWDMAQSAIFLVTPIQ